MEQSILNLIPVLPVRNMVLFPGITVPLRVGRAKSIASIQRARDNGNWLFVVSQKHEDVSKDPREEDLQTVGVLCKIEKVNGTAETGFQVLVRGVERYRASRYLDSNGYIEVEGTSFSDLIDTDGPTIHALLTSLKDISREILTYVPANTAQLQELVEGIEDLGYLTHLCAANLEMPNAKKQELLETISLKARSLALLEIMQRQKENLKVQSEIREKLTTKLGKAQRESILREQIKAIREELGDDDTSTRNEDYRKKITDASMPEDVQKVALDELKRLDAIGNGSPEAHVIRNYLDLLVSMPWKKSAGSEIDLERARKILDADHYGLEKVKRRILQHLAVMKMKGNTTGSILLLVGPPGVGKTSLGESIAKALGRKFVRGSLGGVRDDSEIRGHRRTYIGAMPGRVIQGLKRAGENNPVFMLDEIDKLSRSFQGDPGSALLEVLDPEQNGTFLDHYLDVPFDLSKVFFVATANTLDSIPGPLLDRMEVIDLSGYTTAEKLHIAKQHLLPKQLAVHGLKPEQLKISDEALLRVITHYTREAGVRELQRKLAEICRVATERVVTQMAQAEIAGTEAVYAMANEGSPLFSAQDVSTAGVSTGLAAPVKIETSDLDEILGSEKFIYEAVNHMPMPGIVTGLAWTPVGGEILFIETNRMPGKGQLTLTGQLGDVMKESAQLALSLVRSNLALMSTTTKFDQWDLHVHVPAGAIPKDGPSAGVAMLTAVASLIAGRPVDPKLAMTGEITLRGAVTPVGGIKEKVLAAHRAGITRLILPQRNERDYRDVPQEVRDQLTVSFVSTTDEVLRLALGLEEWHSRPAELAPLLGPVRDQGLGNSDGGPVS